MTANYDPRYLAGILFFNRGALRGAGFLFYRAPNGVWLVDAVPPECLELLEEN